MRSVKYVRNRLLLSVQVTIFTFFLGGQTTIDSPKGTGGKFLFGKYLLAHNIVFAFLRSMRTDGVLYAASIGKQERWDSCNDTDLCLSHS